MALTDAIIKRIKELMKQKNNMTQYQLCKASGLSQSTLSTILTKQVKTIHFITLFDICFGLNIELTDFFNCDYLKFENVER
ncbi:MAG: helix-turn-helix transcriptional regulator [Clostridia bacterium]|nr:helix-turn-helix transcriptional regulator [Clostridia bacterium]